MNTQDIAANVPPITRDYIHLAIQEALSPAIEEIYTQLSYIQAMASKAPDTSTLAAEVANTVEASLANGISQIVTQRTSSLRQECVDAIDTLRSDIYACRQAADKALSGTEYLAANQARPADPTPQIEQAIAPLQLAITNINMTLDTIKSPDVLASIVARNVEASISTSISTLFDRRSALLREELDAALAEVKEETAKAEASTENVLTAVAELHAKVLKWLTGDRYSLTRAQVFKAMREKNNG